MLIFSKELWATKSITMKGFSVLCTNNKQFIFLLIVILFHINVFTSEAPKTPPTLVQRVASPIPMEPPSPTLTIAYPEEIAEEKMEGERSEKKRKFEQGEADEQEATSRSKRQKREEERPQQQPPVAPAAPAAPDAARGEMFFTLGNDYYNGEHGYRQDRNFALQLWQEAARLGHKQAAETLANLQKQQSAPSSAPSSARVQEPTLAELEKAALAGDPEAQNKLGNRYKAGTGVAKDLKKAFELYEQAAKRGYAPAQYNLGVVYTSGEGVAKDLKKAFDLLQQAAQQGHARAQLALKRLQGQKPTIQELKNAADAGSEYAQFEVAKRYALGEGVVKDTKQAAEFFQRAANQGHAPAQYHLGRYYEYGVKDLKKAAELYEQSAKQGYAQAQVALKKLQGQPATIQELEKAAQAGDVYAQTELGEHYYRGTGVVKDLKKAAELFDKAAKQGYPPAQYNLGLFYEYGTGVAKDLKKAYEFFQLAAQHGHATAQVALKKLQGQPATIQELEKAAQAGDVYTQTELGERYYRGTGVVKDLKKAAELFDKAAKRGYAPAQYGLGLSYEYGIGVAKDLKKAYEFFQLAAQHGHATAQVALKRLQGQPATTQELEKAAQEGDAYAQTELGKRYTLGLDVPKDLKKAAELFELAAQQGYAPAQEALKKLQGQAPAEQQQPIDQPRAKKSVAGEIAQALLDAQGTRAATLRILPIASRTLTNLLNGDESLSTKLKVLELFRKARTAGTLATTWKLSAETIKRLSDLVDKETA